MAIIWQNELNGAIGTLTVGGSGLYGDTIASVSGNTAFQQATRYSGTGSLRLGNVNLEGRFTIAPPATSNWSIRYYFYPSANCYYTSQVTNATVSGYGLLTFDDEFGSYSLLGDAIPSGLASAMVGGWCRVEIAFNTNTIVGRIWANPESTGTPDFEVSNFVNLNNPTSFLYLNNEGSGPATGIFLDNIAIGQGEWLGLYQIRDDLFFENTLDGANGTTITTANSASFGQPFGFVQSGPVYSNEQVAHGAGSGKLSGTGSGQAALEISPRPALANGAIRFYLYVGRAPNQGTFEFAFSNLGVVISPLTSTYTVNGTNVAAQAVNLTDRWIRIEMLWLDFSIVTRIWWTDPNSAGTPDYTNTVSTTGSGPGSFMEWLGRNNAGPNYAWVDEIAVAYGGYGWIGPAGITANVEADIAFSGEAEGAVLLPGTATADVDFSADAVGGKVAEAFPSAGVVFSAEIEHVATESGVINAGVVFSAGADGRAQYVGDVSGTAEFSGDVVHSKSTGGDAEADVVFDGSAHGQFQTSLPDVTRVGLRYRLIAYSPNGTMIGQLPYPLSFQVGSPFNDLPSLTLEYLKDSPGWSLLQGHVEIAVELATLVQPQYVEYPGMRFISLREGDDPTDRMGIVRYTMPHYGWQTRKARNLNVAAHDDEGRRQFSAATPGRILHTFLTEAQARGWNPGMSWNFTPTRDSAGQPWESVYTIEFDLGQDVWTILSTLADQGAFDWRFHRRQLQLFNPDTALARNRTNEVVLHLERDITQAPNDRSSEELAARTLVKGDGDNWVMVDQVDSARPWGYWEDYLSQPGVTDTGTLQTLARWWLQKSRQPLVQMTRGILFPTTRYMPFRDYLPGDYITAPSGTSMWDFSTQDTLRVRQITLASADDQGMEGALVLNERFVESNLRRDRKLNALAGGAGNNPGGGGGRPSDDTRTPKAPTNLILASETYINQIGEPRGQITATWTQVTEATNNTAMDMRSYEVWVRLNEPGEPWWQWTTVDYNENSAQMSPFDPERVYQVRVRAIGRNGYLSGFSAVQSVLVQRDTTPPDVPSDPVLESRLGVVRITWDGLSEFGTEMPLDTDFVTVWMNDNASETGWEAIDTLYVQGVSVVPNLPYDTEFWFRFTATDRSGNESEPSGMASISVQQLVPGDITPGSIGYELLEEGAVRDDILADDAVRNRHIAAGEITGEKVRAYSLFADRIAVGNTRNLLTDPKHVDADMNQLRLDLAEGSWAYNFDATNSQDRPYIWRQNNPNGTYRYYWVQNVETQSLTDPAGYIDVASELGRMIGSARVTVSGRTAGTVVVTFFARFLDRQGGALSENPAVIGFQTFTSDVANHEMISNNGAGVPTAAAYALFYVEVTFNGANDNVWVGISRPFTALSNGAVLIENGAVSANKIQANAITADKIDVGAVTAVAIAADAITTDKLAANAITAKHTITGATIQTTASVNRGLKITSTGMRGYDNVGNETFSYESATGIVRTTGRFQTGIVTGNNVVIDANLYQGRPAVQLNTGNSAQLQPVLYSMGGGSSDYPAGAVLLHGRETTVNSSGRNTLQLNSGNGSGASLTQEYGSFGGMGFSYSGWDMFLRGRKTNGHNRLDNLIAGVSSSFDPGAVVFTYGQAAPNGQRVPQVTAYRNTTNPEAGVTLRTASLSGFSVNTWNNSGSGSVAVRYFSLWMGT